jgi:DNA-binding transcriptional LysR family regulator
MLSRTLTPFITEVKERMPDLTLEILVMSTEAQERALLSGAIDVGFVRYWIPTESLAFDPISHEYLALICPENYQAEGSVEAIMAGLAEKPFIGVSRSAAKGLSETISAVCGEYGLQPVLAYECNDAFSIMGLVAAGLGWSIVPGFDLSETGAPTVTRIPLVQKISIGISYRLAGLSAPAEAFISHARAFFSRTT